MVWSRAQLCIVVQRAHFSFYHSQPTQRRSKHHIMGCALSAPAPSTSAPPEDVKQPKKKVKDSQLSVLERITKDLNRRETECDERCNENFNLCCQEIYIPICCCIPGPVDDDKALNDKYRACQFACCCSCCQSECCSCCCQSDQVVKPPGSKGGKLPPSVTSQGKASQNPQNNKGTKNGGKKKL